MTVFITKRISTRTRRLLSAYNAEVSLGVYVGYHNEGMYMRILKWLRKNIKGNEKILILRPDKSWIGFSDEYFNWESQAVYLDGV